MTDKYRDIQQEFNKMRSELVGELSKYPQSPRDWADDLSDQSYDWEGISAETLREVEERGYRRGLKEGLARK